MSDEQESEMGWVRFTLLMLLLAGAGAGVTYGMGVSIRAASEEAAAETDASWSGAVDEAERCLTDLTFVEQPDGSYAPYCRRTGEPVISFPFPH